MPVTTKYQPDWNVRLQTRRLQRKEMLLVSWHFLDCTDQTQKIFSGVKSEDLCADIQKLFNACCVTVFCLMCCCWREFRTALCLQAINPANWKHRQSCTSLLHDESEKDFVVVLKHSFRSTPNMFIHVDGNYGNAFDKSWTPTVGFFNFLLNRDRCEVEFKFSASFTLGEIHEDTKENKGTNHATESPYAFGIFSASFCDEVIKGIYAAGTSVIHALTEQGIKDLCYPSRADNIVQCGAVNLAS